LLVWRRFDATRGLAEKQAIMIFAARFNDRGVLFDFSDEAARVTVGA
jgi:hypothetical protein